MRYQIRKFVATLALAGALSVTGGVGQVQARTVKICAVLPISGANAATGIGMMNSMDLAVKEINASGTMGDIRLELVELDDASQPATGINAVMRAAADPDVLACSAHWNSPVAIATRNVFHRNGLANLTPASITAALTEKQPGDEIFRMAPPDTWQVQAAARFPLALGKKRYYLIDDNTLYGKSLVQQMEQYATALGATSVGADSISVGEKDFSAVLTRAKATSPDFIFFGGVTTESALLRRQSQQLDMKSMFYTGSGTMSPTFVSIAGSAADGTFAYFYGLPYQSYPGGKAFVENYHKAGYSKPYETYGIWAYAAIQALAQAIRNAQAHGRLNRRGVIDELKTDTFKTALGDVSFPKPGDIKQRVMGYYEVIDGKWQMIYVTDADGKLTKLAKPEPLDGGT